MINNKQRIMEKNFSKGIVLLLTRTAFLYLLLGIILFNILDREKISGNFLAHTKDYAEDLYLSSYKNKDKIDKNLVSKAEVYFRALLGYLPSNALARANLGFCYFYLNEKERAIESYKKAIESEPRLYTFYYDLAYIYLVSKDYSNSIESFFDSLSRIPASKAYYYSILGSNVKIIEGLKKQIDMLYQRSLYDREQIFVNIAEAYYQMKDYNNMKKISLEGLKVFRNNDRLYYYAGLSFYYVKDYRKAVEYLTVATRLEPNHSKAYYFRAESFKELGLGSNFKSDMKRAIDNEGIMNLMT